MRTNPNDYVDLFGRHFVTKNTSVVLEFGGKIYNKYNLGQIGCPHPNAAANVHRVMKQLGVKSAEDLVERFTPERLLRIKGFLEANSYVIVALLRDAGVNPRRFFNKKVTVATIAHNARKDHKAFRAKIAR